MSEPNFNKKYIEELSEEDLEREEADRIYKDEVIPRLEKMEKMENYVRLYQISIRENINVGNVFEHTGIKLSYLENIMGYQSVKGLDTITKLKSKERSGVLVGKEKAQIGHVYKKCYFEGEKYK